MRVFHRVLVLNLVGAITAAAQQKVDIARACVPEVSLRISGAVGHLRIVAWDRDSIAVTGGLGAGSRLEAGTLIQQGNVPNLPPLTGMKFYVEAADDAALSTNRLEVRVPRGARVWVKTGSADIEASGVTGGLDLNIVGGSVRVNADPRELIIESMDGAVSFDGQGGYVRIKTATGDITMRGGGEDLSLASISGNITVPGATVQRGRFESVTGGIIFAGEVARGGEARFDSHSGAVELRLAPRADVELDAASITGAIENRFSTHRPSAGREGRGMELVFSSGNASARVQVRTFKGNVRLARNP